MVVLKNIVLEENLKEREEEAMNGGVLVEEKEKEENLKEKEENLKEREENPEEDGK